jgi:hypothetical protein
MVKNGGISLTDSKTNISTTGIPMKDAHGIQLLRLSSFGDRAFCVDCHTPLGMRYDHTSPANYSIALGTVDETSIRDAEVKKALEPGFQIFVSQRAWWCRGVGKDELRSHGRFPGTFEEEIKAWEKAKL